MLKSNEQRIAEMHKRAAMIEHKAREAKARLYYVCAGLVAAMFFIVFILPGLSGSSADGVIGQTQNVLYGSIFSDKDILNYVIVGIFAFILGIALTIFCYKLNRWRKESGEEKDER